MKFKQSILFLLVLTQICASGTVASQERAPFITNPCFYDHKETNGLAAKPFEGELFSKDLFFTTHDGAFHFPIAISVYGEEITFEDGSVWGVAPHDQWKTLNFFANDRLLVMQNKWCSSYYQFMIVNQSTGMEVECNLIRSPHCCGPSIHWIVAIDFYHYTVTLEDGSVWNIDPVEYPYISSWLLNDLIIIGFNQEGCSCHPNILINAYRLNYACGICVY